MLIVQFDVDFIIKHNTSSDKTKAQFFGQFIVQRFKMSNSKLNGMDKKENVGLAVKKKFVQMTEIDMEIFDQNAEANPYG